MEVISKNIVKDSIQVRYLPYIQTANPRLISITKSGPQSTTRLGPTIPLPSKEYSEIKTSMLTVGIV